MRGVLCVNVFCIMLAVCLVWLRQAEAIPRRNWTYGDLWSESEFVCIARIHSTKSVENKVFDPKYLDRYESQLKVLVVLKGDKDPGTVRFTHYRYKAGVNRPGNGPTFPVLRDTAAVPETNQEGDHDGDTDPKLTFLLFLRRHSDNTYGPVSGDSDADLSVARLHGYADDK